MGLIRSKNTELTPMSSDEDLTRYLWPIVREMVKTVIENRQNLIVEGCYISFDWQKDFEMDELVQIQYYCLIMSEDYIKKNFSKMKAYASVIEYRGNDESCTMESVLADNARFLELAQKHRVNYLLIDHDYKIDMDL